MNPPAVSERRSSATGHCSDVSDSDRVCNTPRSSVLFDGIIPTLTGLDGDMWATQLLTLNTSTSSNITFNFNGMAYYVGVGTIEVVMFSCSIRGIGTNSISIRSSDDSPIGNINDIPQSCEYLVRACISDGFTTTEPILSLNFNDALQRVYLAEVTLYTNSRACSNAVLNESVPTTSSTPISVTTLGSKKQFLILYLTCYRRYNNTWYFMMEIDDNIDYLDRCRIGTFHTMWDMYKIIFGPSTNKYRSIVLHYLISH